MTKFEIRREFLAIASLVVAELAIPAIAKNGSDVLIAVSNTENGGWITNLNGLKNLVVVPAPLENSCVFVLGHSAPQDGFVAKFPL